MWPQNTPPEVIEHLQSLYSTYRRTTDRKKKTFYFSPTCIQICRPQPSYAATNRQQIEQYQREAAPDTDDASEKKLRFYTLRTLAPAEHDFGDDSVTKNVGFTVAELKQRAEEEDWIGMRADLWEEKEEGMLVKVQYWWRYEAVEEDERFEGCKEGNGWRQCLHDIMYIGPRDGTEGADGNVRE
jgi:hypothetical protein